MTHQDEQIQEFELTIEAAKKNVALAEALQRLHQNPDFKQVILEGYFRDEPARLVGLLADPQMQDTTQQGYLNGSLRAVSELRQHFGKIFHFGELSHRAIEESQRAIVEIENGFEVDQEG